MTELLIALIGVAGTILSSVLTFIFTKKKYHAEVDDNIIQNMQKSLDFYKKLSDDNSKRLEDVLQRNRQLEAEVADLRKIVLGMVTQICTDIMCQHRQIDQSACKYYEALRNSETTTMTSQMEEPEDE